MARRTVARKHRVNATWQVLGLTKAGTSIELEIYADDEKLGTIVIGRGALYWTAANKQKGKRIDWTRFARLMDEVG